MKFEINEEDINQYANQRMKQLVDQNVKARLDEIKWYNTIDRAVYESVKERLKADVIQKVLSKLDRKALIEDISKYIAENIVDMMFRDE